MAQFKITVDEDILRGIFSGDDGLGRLVETVLNQVLEAQVAEQLQAGRHERTESRRGYRNGHRVRQMKTRVGTLDLLVPRVRDGHFSTKLFGRYQRSEQALVLALMEMVINGVSTRKVRRITEELCGTSFSKSTVSALCRQLDPIVHGWNERSLSDETYPFVIVDALYIKVRKEGRVRSQSVLLAIGISGSGHREILGLKVGDSESESSWSAYFAWLKDRGLQGVDILVSDDHRGLVKAVHRHFQGASWQRCQTHLTRNILDHCPKALRDELHSRLRLIFDAPDGTVARRVLDDTLEAYGEQAPKAVQCLEQGFDDATAVLALPSRYRRRLRTTNSVERLNQEIRRRERVIRIFPNMESAVRLIGALLMEQDEDWSTGRKYLNMAEYWEWKAEIRKARPVALAAGGAQLSATRIRRD